MTPPNRLLSRSSRASLAPLVWLAALCLLAACGDDSGSTPNPSTTSETSETSTTSGTSETSTTSDTSQTSTTSTTSELQDRDEDGVEDDEDNCPDDANTDQLDTDEDGVGDVCDLCPEDAANDADDDSVCAPEDNCPDDANTDQNDADGDGLGDVCDPLTDRDEDGVADDEDNCPDDANEDQENADGDDLGDLCDPCPLFADTDTCDAETEVEPNDSPFDPGLNRTVPFIVNGVVGDAGDGDGDLDYFSFTAEAGTTLKIRLQADGASFFGAALMFGLSAGTNDFARVLINTDFNSTNEREVFIYATGEYTIAVSDLRNLTAAPEGVGGEEGYNYTLTVREFEPEVRNVESLPLSDLVEFNERVHIWSVPAEDALALSLSASSSTFDPNAIHIPSFTLYDPDTQTVLKTTNNDEVTDQSVSGPAILNGAERYWFVLDMIQGFGPGATDVQVRALELDGENEPNNTEPNATPLLTPGSLDARIDTPQPDLDTNVLRADIDFFVFRAVSGETLRFDLTPGNGSEFNPSLEIGGLYSWGSFDSWIVSENISEANPASTITFVAPEDGFYYLRIRDLTNLNLSPDEDPVGGLNHTYTITSTSVSIPDELPIASTVTAPGQQTFTFTEPGVPILVEVDAEPSLPLELTAQNAPGTSVRLTAFDAETLSPLGAVRFGSLSVATPDSGRVLVVLSETLARSGDDLQVTLSAIQLTLEDIGPLPYITPERTLEVPGEADLLRFSLSAGEVLDVRLEETGSGDLFPVLELHPADDLSSSVATSYSRALLYRAQEDQELVLRISDLSNDGGPDYTYGLAMRSINPEPIEDIPTTLNVPADEVAAAGYFLLTTEEITPILFDQSLENAPDDEDAYFPRLIVYDWDRLFQVRGTSEPNILFSTEANTTYLVVLTEAQSRSSEGMNLSLSIGGLSTTEVDLPYSAVETLDEAGSPLYYQFDIPAETLLHVEATSTTEDSARPSIRLYNAEGFGLIASNQPPNAFSWYNQDPLSAIVEIVDVGVFDITSLNVSLTSVDAFEESSEVEPNSLLEDATAVDTLPARIQGVLEPELIEGVETPDEDWYAITLEAGDRISAITVSAPGEGITDTTLSVNNAAGEELAFNDDGGLGTFSRIEAFTAPEAGTFFLRVRPFGSGTGSYALVIDRLSNSEN